MEIKKVKNAEVLELALAGRLDTTTAPQLEAELSGQLNGITELVIDFGAVEYISSAGLRTLLYLRQTLGEVNGTLAVRNVPRIVMNIFEVTDFHNIIKII